MSVNLAASNHRFPTEKRQDLVPSADVEKYSTVDGWGLLVHHQRKTVGPQVLPDPSDTVAEHCTVKEETVHHLNKRLCVCVRVCVCVRARARRRIKGVRERAKGKVRKDGEDEHLSTETEIRDILTEESFDPSAAVAVFLHVYDIRCKSQDQERQR
jgi:hypothetical protein